MVKQNQHHQFPSVSLLQPRSDSITFQILLASTAICKVRLAMPSQQLCTATFPVDFLLPLWFDCLYFLHVGVYDDIGTFVGMGVPKCIFLEYLRRFLPFFHIGCLCVRAWCIMYQNWVTLTRFNLHKYIYIIYVHPLQKLYYIYSNHPQTSCNTCIK